MKLLLYCTKAKPYLLNQNVYEFYDSKYITSNLKCHKDCDYTLNGKIVAECDFEIEKIFEDNYEDARDGYVEHFYTLKSYDDFDEGENVLLKESCLQKHELSNYFGFDDGYAIHIKNLHIFDKPRELDFYSSNFDYFKKVEKAHQNMMKVWEDQESPRVLISIRPQWLVRILNGEKQIEVRKKVLKEMI